jgi:hypothetical protein
MRAEGGSLFTNMSRRVLDWRMAAAIWSACKRRRRWDPLDRSSTSESSSFRACIAARDKTGYLGVHLSVGL